MELMVIVMWHRMDNEAWKEDELPPITNLEIADVTPVGSALGASITLYNGDNYIVDFRDIDGNELDGP
ncbi:MAG TPA: hypothetical protein VKA27_14295 [Sunxiuqinia sp.]|nr:hypothetical protein [Sunxiuqinia sp.]